MRALFYISTEIGEDNILWGMLELPVEAAKSECVVELSAIKEDQIEYIAIESKAYDFVITRSFSVNVAEGCHISGTPYIAWCYDSPVIALYRQEALYSTNYIYVFDKMHLKRLRDIGIEHAYYQPLAANITKSELAVITERDKKDYQCDVSFVGSMYCRDFYERFKSRATGEAISECEKIFKKHMCQWRENDSVFDELKDKTVEELYSLLDDNRKTKLSISDRYLTELLVLVPELSFRERYGFIDRIGLMYDTVVRTRDPDKIVNTISATVRPAVDQLSDELFKIYASAKINLNITMRSIETGIPQRIYDIMSIGGCVFSNYQEDIPDLFEPDKEIIVFGSMEEFIDKANYYLQHEKDRMKVCIGGYRRVSNCYTYPIAINRMISDLF